jgi:hypothetical protein
MGISESASMRASLAVAGIECHQALAAKMVEAWEASNILCKRSLLF